MFRAAAQSSLSPTTTATYPRFHRHSRSLRNLQQQRANMRSTVAALAILATLFTRISAQEPGSPSLSTPVSSPKMIQYVSAISLPLTTLPPIPAISLTRHVTLPLTPDASQP